MAFEHQDTTVITRTYSLFCDDCGALAERAPPNNYDPRGRFERGQGMGITAFATRAEAAMAAHGWRRRDGRWTCDVCLRREQEVSK